MSNDTTDVDHSSTEIGPQQTLQRSKVFAAFRAGTRSVRLWVAVLTAVVVTASHHSGLRRSAVGLSRAVRHSYPYRWLTKPPSRDTLVIDLRETWTVGPVIGLFEHAAVASPVRRAASQTGTVVASLGSHVARAPIRWLSALTVGIASIRLVQTWITAGVAAGPVLLTVLALAVLGLRIDASWQTIARSRLGDAVRPIRTPPTADGEVDDADSG